MNYFELSGLIGGLLLAFCGLPEVIHTYKTGAVRIGWSMLVLWILGEILLYTNLVYIGTSVGAHINYLLNIAFLLYLCYNKYLEYRKSENL